MRRLPLLCLALLAAACDPTAPPAPPAPVALPGLSLTSEALELGESVQGRRFRVTGRKCKTLVVKLLHITPTDVNQASEHTITELPESFDGEFWLLEQNGKPFGKPELTIITLKESFQKGRRLSSSRDLTLPTGATTQHVDTKSAYEQGKEDVVLARCTMKNNGSFSSGNVEALKKQAADLKNDILAVTIRWEAVPEASGR